MQIKLPFLLNATDVETVMQFESLLVAQIQDGRYIKNALELQSYVYADDGVLKAALKSIFSAYTDYRRTQNALNNMVAVGVTEPEQRAFFELAFNKCQQELDRGVAVKNDYFSDNNICWSEQMNKFLVGSTSSELSSESIDVGENLSPKADSEISEKTSLGSIDSNGNKDQEAGNQVGQDIVQYIPTSDITSIQYTKRVGTSFLQTRNGSVYPVLIIYAEKKTNTPIKGFIGTNIQVDFNLPFTKSLTNSSFVNSLTLAHNKVQVSKIKLGYKENYVTRVGVGYRPFDVSKNTFISINHPMKALNIRSIGIEGSLSYNSLFRMGKVQCGSTLKVNFIPINSLFSKNFHNSETNSKAQALSSNLALPTNSNTTQWGPLASLPMRHINFGADFDDCLTSHRINFLSEYDNSFHLTSKLNEKNQAEIACISISENPGYDVLEPAKNTTFSPAAVFFGVGFVVTSFICSKIFEKFYNKTKI